jgi:signal transduction histidine kinase/CheY-like chemotaxis protein
MQPIKKFLEASFRIRILLPVVLVMSLMLAVTSYIVNRQFQSYTDKNGRMELKSAAMQMERNFLLYQGRLKLRFEPLVRVPSYRAVFEKQDAKTIYSTLNQMYDAEQLEKEKIQFIFFSPANPSAGPAASASRNRMLLTKEPISSINIFNAAAPALREVRLNETSVCDTVQLGDRLYELIATPVFNSNSELLGVVTFGQWINWEVLQQFNFGTDTAFIGMVGNALAVGGVSDGVVRPLQTFRDAEMTPEFSTNLIARFQELSRKPLTTAEELRRDPAADLHSLQVGDSHYFYTAAHFKSLAKSDAGIGYLLFRKYDDSLELARTTQQVLLPAIIILIFVGSVIVLFFINKATAPLRELHAAAEAVGHGDFSQRVHLASKDEFGELGRAFNQMTENIELSQSKLKQTVETLKTTQAQLIQSEKLSAVGEFVAGVAHELNNPLAAVMGFSEMLKNGDVSEKHSRHLDMIFKSAQRCQKIVQSLLSFARRAAPERKPVSVNKLIEDVLEMISYPLRTSNVKVVTRFSQQMPVVLADGHQVQQVVLNIISNARQAIETHAQAGCITIATTNDARWVRIVISDNGPGIAAENLKRIFDPFFTTKEVGKGTGLGLSLCYGMIREHGGNILVASQPGSGAIFTIELPVADEAAWFETSFMTQTTTATNQPEAREGVGKKILVVDDEESLLHMIKEELTLHSYDVMTVPNGEAALRATRGQKFDAIICDLKMPGLNGRQVYEKLREENVDAARRMVFVTGDIIGDQLRNFLETEKRRCLNKPFTLGDLRQAVKETLAGK